MGRVVCPPNSYVVALIPSTSEYTVSGDRVFKEILKLKYGPHSGS